MPLSSDTGLLGYQQHMDGICVDAATPGTRHTLNVMDDFVQHLLGYIDRTALKPLKIVVNAR